LSEIEVAMKHNNRLFLKVVHFGGPVTLVRWTRFHFTR